nr:MAG TPA: hypothetical protein [Bacteriophage sp.]
MVQIISNNRGVRYTSKAYFQRGKSLVPQISPINKAPVPTNKAAYM